MSRRALGLIAAVLVLAAATTATAASTNKSVTPKLGYYESTLGYSTAGPRTAVQVVKIGNRLGAKFRVEIGLTCAYSDGTKTHDVFAYQRSQKTPIPIKDGKFAYNRTTHGPVAAGSGTATYRPVISGTFRSATKVVVKESVNVSFIIQYPEQPEIKGTCTGKQTATAKLKHP